MIWSLTRRLVRHQSSLAKPDISWSHARTVEVIYRSGLLRYRIPLGVEASRKVPILQLVVAPEYLASLRPTQQMDLLWLCSPEGQLQSRLVALQESADPFAARPETWQPLTSEGPGLLQ